MFSLRAGKWNPNVAKFESRSEIVFSQFLVSDQTDYVRVVHEEVIKGTEKLE